MPPEETDRPIADAVLPAEIEELAVPVELDELAPWHRPRKQLVREEQWIRLSRQLIRRERGRPGLREPPEGEPEVRYLTLPGIDYLDVRQLAGLCAELDCCLTSTGFQSGGEGNPYVARAQLREKSLIDAGHITGHSNTFARRFEDISHTNSDAYRDVRRRGPFNIVNIDACGSLARPGADHANRLVEAVYRIVELQLQLMNGRWLLFVTTDVQRESIAQETLERLCAAIFANADDNENFRQLAAPLLQPGEADIRNAARAAAERTGMTFLQLFSLGLAKWFLHFAHEKEWDMQTHHPYCYSTTPGHDDTPSMACLAFEFLPPAPGLEDRFGVVRAEPAPNPVRGDTSVRAAERIRDMANADVEIGRDEGLRNRMTENLRCWLEEAGYGAGVLEELGA